jgi:perosamine synthetase
MSRSNKVVLKMAFIPVAEPQLGEKELEYVTDCINSNWISSIGDYIVSFEKGFAKFCDSKYAIAVSNGTAALHLALAAIGIGPGDEVIIPALTFVATASAVIYTGASPILVDSDPKTWNVNPEGIEERITARTKAIIPVHLYGHPCDMDPIMEIAKRHNLKVVEDAAEAHGAEYKGRKAGSIGDVGCFSFYGNKIITTGEGGMCVTNHKALAERMRFLRDHAMSKTKRYWHPEVGYNYRITNIQAAIGLAQLEKIEEFIEKKRENASYYNSLLNRSKGVILPTEEEYAKNVYWMYSILIENEYGIDRDTLMKRLREKDIDSRPFFYPVHKMPFFEGSQDYPVAEDLSKRGINLPSSVKLRKDQIERIVDIIKSIYKSN